MWSLALNSLFATLLDIWVGLSVNVYWNSLLSCRSNSHHYIIHLQFYLETFHMISYLQTFYANSQFLLQSKISSAFFICAQLLSSSQSYIALLQSTSSILQATLVNIAFVLGLFTISSTSECFFAGKGTAMVLSLKDIPPSTKRRLSTDSNRSTNSSSGNNSEIQQHLQSMFYLLRHEETLKMVRPLSTVWYPYYW